MPHNKYNENNILINNTRINLSLQLVRPRRIDGVGVHEYAENGF